MEQISTQTTKSAPTVSTSVIATTLHSTSLKSLQEEKVEQVEKRRPLGDITKKSINVSNNNQATTNQTQVTEKNLNLLNKSERKRNLLRKKPNDVASKKQKN